MSHDDGEPTLVPHAAEHVHSSAPHGAVISFAESGLGRDLRNFYPEVAFVDEASPLGLTLRRLSESLDAADTHAERGFTSDLVGVAAARREALLLVPVEDLTYESAAARIGYPPGTVKSCVSWARDRLAAEPGEA